MIVCTVTQDDFDKATLLQNLEIEKENNNLSIPEIFYTNELRDANVTDNNIFIISANKGFVMNQNYPEIIALNNQTGNEWQAHGIIEIYGKWYGKLFNVTTQKIYLMDQNQHFNMTAPPFNWLSCPYFHKPYTLIIEPMDDILLGKI